jgi:hypothetical protein
MTNIDALPDNRAAHQQLMRLAGCRVFGEILMSIRNRNLLVLSAVLGAALLVTGCQKHSHVTVSSYEYSERGSAEPIAVQEPPANQPSGEYQMVSPGEMTSPGEMSSPGRMVVEPRRDP